MGQFNANYLKLKNFWDLKGLGRKSEQLKKCSLYKCVNTLLQEGLQFYAIHDLIL